MKVALLKTYFAIIWISLSIEFIITKRIYNICNQIFYFNTILIIPLLIVSLAIVTFFLKHLEIEILAINKRLLALNLLAFIIGSCRLFISLQYKCYTNDPYGEVLDFISHTIIVSGSGCVIAWTFIMILIKFNFILTE